MQRIELNRVLWIAQGTLALMAAAAGIAAPSIYESLVEPRIIPGVFTQDLFVAAGSLLMLALAITAGPRDFRKTTILLGLTGFLFYAYGIYAMEQVYTMLYPVYLAVFGLSFFSMIVAGASLVGCGNPGAGNPDVGNPAGGAATPSRTATATPSLRVPRALRFGAAAYGIFIAIVFNIIWLAQLIPLLQTGNRIENTFSIFIIDLCFIMPAFVVSAVMAIRNRPLGVVGLPALFILGIGILSPLALAELLKPSRYGLPVDTGQLSMYLVLSVVFAVFGVVYLAAMRVSDGGDAR